MARIQFLLPSVSPSGGVFSVLRHADGLARLGHDVAVVSVALPDPGIRDVLPQVVAHLPIAPLAADGLSPADVQVATHFTTVPLVGQASGRLKVHFMQHLEELFAVDEPDPGSFVEAARYCFRLPLYRLANSRWLQDQYARLYGSRPTLVHNGVDAPDEGPLPAWPDDPPVVVSYAHTFRWKGTREAYRTMQLVRGALPDRDVQWHVFGQAPQIPAEPWIRRLGTVPHDALRAHYQRAHVMLSVSWAESYHVPVLEAMAAGTVVVTQPFGTEDFARDGDTAWVVPPRDVDAAARAVVRALLAGEAAARPMRERARREAAQHSWARATAQMAQALEHGLAEWHPTEPARVTERLLERLGIPPATTQ